MRDRDMYAALESGATLQGVKVTARQRKLWSEWYDSKQPVTDADAIKAVCTFIGAITAGFPDWYLIEKVHRERKARPVVAWREVSPDGARDGALRGTYYGPALPPAMRPAGTVPRDPACVRGNPFTGDDGSAYDRAAGDGGANREYSSTGWKGTPTLTRRELDHAQRVAAAPVWERPPGRANPTGNGRHPSSRSGKLASKSAYGRCYIPGQDV